MLLGGAGLRSLLHPDREALSLLPRSQRQHVVIEVIRNHNQVSVLPSATSISPFVTSPHGLHQRGHCVAGPCPSVFVRVRPQAPVVGEPDAHAGCILKPALQHQRDHTHAARDRDFPEADPHVFVISTQSFHFVYGWHTTARRRYQARARAVRILGREGRQRRFDIDCGRTDRTHVENRARRGGANQKQNENIHATTPQA